MKKISLLLSLTVIAFAFSAKPAMAQEIPLDPELRKGVLDNGITYYIRHNEEPKERASFYIMQNVGALLEEDNQNGLAHFLEHMAFNGTKHFPGKGIINTLQKSGVEFGRNLNAYTAFDETVYNISEVPNTAEMMDTCLLILHDWCNYLLLTEEEIDAERGVITEEWRTRNTARSRMWNKRTHYMLADSKYTKRDVIGSLDIIQNFEYETLRNFYHDWYRTDLQGIAIVGDFDVDKMEEKVKALFSHIPAVENKLERYHVDIPFNDAPIFGLITDKEATKTSINVTFKHEQTPMDERDEAFYHETIVRSLYEQMFSDRIGEIMQQKEPPFLNGYSAYFEYFIGLDMYYIDAATKKGEEGKGLEAIMIENERAKRYGFTEGELERAKLNFLSQFESAYKQRDKISNDNHAKEYVRNFLKNESVPGIAYELELVKKHLPTITTEELNQKTKEWISYKHMVVIVNGPENDKIEYITEEQAFGIIDAVKTMEIAPYVDKTVSTSLLEKLPKASKVKKTVKLPVLQAEEWTLKNGIKIIYRFSDIEKDRIYLSALSKGGSSLYNTEDLPSAGMTSLVGEFGIGDFDPTTLSKMLAGKNIEVSPYVGELSEGISANSTIQDVETMFQLLYMTFEQPRFDETLFQSTLAQYYAYLENKKNNPKAAINDSISLITTGYHPRTLLFNEAFLDQVSLKSIERIYNERFADANDFTFFITGNITKDELQPLVETYIGGLDVLKGDENWVDNGVKLPSGSLQKDINIKMETAKGTVSIKYGNAKIDYTPENKVYANILADILNIRYMESVREEEGGTYGVGVRCGINQYPENEATLSIGFDCDPEKAKKLIPVIYKELEKLKTEGPTQDDLDIVLTTSKKNRVQSFEKNNFWLEAMRAKYWRNMDIVSPSYYEDIVAKVTPEDIKAFTAELLEKSDKVELVFLPQADK